MQQLQNSTAQIVDMQRQLDLKAQTIQELEARIQQKEADLLVAQQQAAANETTQVST